MYEVLKTEAADEADLMVVIKATEAEVATVGAGGNTIFIIPPFCKFRAEGKSMLYHMLSVILGFEIWFVELFLFFKEDFHIHSIRGTRFCRAVEQYLLEANPDDETDAFRGSRALFPHYGQLLRTQTLQQVQNGLQSASFCGSNLLLCSRKNKDYITWIGIIVAASMSFLQGRGKTLCNAAWHFWCS